MLVGGVFTVTGTNIYPVGTSTSQKVTVAITDPTGHSATARALGSSRPPRLR